MAIDPITAHEIWKRVLGVISLHATEGNSKEIIPEKVDPYVRQLHGKLFNCECKLGACDECVWSRRVLMWTWEKLDFGF